MLKNFHTSHLASGNSELFSIVSTVCYFVIYKHCMPELPLLELVVQKAPSPQETTAQATGKPQLFYQSTHTLGE